MDDTGYESNDPKSPDYHDRMSEVWDNRDKFEEKPTACICRKGAVHYKCPVHGREATTGRQ